MVHLIFIGPFPPPIHGQAIATQTIARDLEAHGLTLRRINAGEGAARGRISGIANRLVRLTISLFWIAFSRAPAVYVSVNANKGMIVTIILAFMARIRRKKLYLHHHTYDHIRNHRGTMSWLAKAAGPYATHITICPAMGSELKAQYRTEVTQTHALNNVGSVDSDLGRICKPRRDELVLGFMSNLTMAKGLARAIGSFLSVKERGLAVKLVIGGPCKEDDARRELEKAVAAHGTEVIDYRGPVYGAEKTKFFSDIDVFVFPSLYKGETQGIVNLEALASGTPVIAFGLCCIPSDLTGPACRIVEPQAEFVDGLISFLAELADQDGHLSSENAKKRFKEIQQLYAYQIQELCERVKSLI